MRWERPYSVSWCDEVVHDEGVAQRQQQSRIFPCAKSERKETANPGWGEYEVSSTYTEVN